MNSIYLWHLNKFSRIFNREILINWAVSFYRCLFSISPWRHLFKCTSIWCISCFNGNITITVYSTVKMKDQRTGNSMETNCLKVQVFGVYFVITQTLQLQYIYSTVKMKYQRTGNYIQYVNHKKIFLKRIRYQALHTEPAKQNNSKVECRLWRAKAEYG